MKKVAFLLSIVWFLGLQTAYSQFDAQKAAEVLLPKGAKVKDDTKLRRMPAAVIEWQNPEGGMSPVGYSTSFSGKSPLPFYAITVNWKTATNAETAEDFFVSFQTRVSGGEWSEPWVAQAEISPDETPTKRFGSEIFMPITNGALHNEFRVEVVNTQNAPLSYAVVTVTDATLPNEAAMPTPAAQPLPLPSGCPVMPALIYRSEWWGNLPQDKYAYTPTYQSITHIFVHHTAGALNPSNPQATMRSMWDYHVNTNGWTDIGYNYVFDHLGNVYQGRYNPQFPNTEVKGAHAGVNNTNTIGVSFMGTFSTVLPTNSALNTAVNFMGWECKVRNLNPLQQAVCAGKMNFRICGHRDGAQASTACPGDTLYSRLPLFRSTISQMLTACNAPPCGSPAGLSASGIQTFSAALNWVAVSGATGYVVRYRKSGTTTWTSANVTTNSLGIAGLTALTTYEWQVAAVCAAGTGDYVSGTNFTTPGLSLCAQPWGLAVNTVWATQAFLGWNAASGATSYTVRYRVLGTTDIFQFQTTTNSINLQGLTPGVTYEWWVNTLCNGVSTKFTAGTNFTTVALCAASGGLSVTGLSATAATLNWNAVSGANGYLVSYRQKGSNNWITQQVTATTLSLNSLTMATQYEWRVVTLCGCGPATPTLGADFTTLNSCAAPNGLTVGTVGTTTAALSWSAITGASGYTISYRIVGTTTWATANVSTNSATLGGLSPTSNYEWQVAAQCSGSLSAYSSVSSFSTLTPCNAPMGLSSANITTNGAKLSWSSVPTATSYKVEYQAVGQSVWQSVNVTGTTTNLSGLLPTTIYFWQVTATCPSGVSAASATATFSTLTPCNTPTGLASANITTSGATVSWASVSTATTYKVEYQAVGQSVWQSVNVTGTTTTLNSLSSNTVYNWKVTATCPSGVSAASATATFTTLINCQTPTSLSSSAINTGTATLTWNTVISATGYIIYYRAAGAPSWTTVNTATNSYVLNGLTGSTTYEWQVAAVCGAANSANSATANFTTLANCYDPYEANNSSTTATVLPIGTPYNAKICGAGDVDWFKVTLLASANIRVTLSNLPDNYQLELYINSVFVTGSYNSGTTNEVIIRNGQAAGMLFYRVYGQNSVFNSTVDYQILAETSPNNFRTAPNDSGEENPSFLLAPNPVSALYPNPVENGRFYLNLRLPEESPVTVEIFDAAGKSLQAQTLELSAGEHTQPFDLEHLAKGLYMVQVRSRFGVESHRAAKW